MELKMLLEDSLVEELWEITEGKCMFCGKKLIWKNRGKNGAKGAWKTGLIDSSSKQSVLSNCELDCLNCYNQTRL